MDSTARQMTVAPALGVLCFALAACGPTVVGGHHHYDAAEPDLDGALDAQAEPDAQVEQDGQEPTLVNQAEFVSQEVPANVTTDEAFTATVTMRNAGTTTWSAATGYTLGSTDPQDNVVWGTNRGAMEAGVEVGPGETYAFTLSLVAPAQAGDAGMRWQMLQDAVEWFGAKSDPLTVTVEAEEVPPIDLATVVYHDSVDVSGWTETKTISRVELSDVDGVLVTLTPYDPTYDADSWPDFIMWPPDGHLRYTLWLFVYMGGLWHGAAVHEYWCDRTWTGAPLLTSYADWIYPNPGSPWGEMGDYVPQQGDMVGFMATAGDLRRHKDVFTVTERSNVVMVPLAPTATYNF